MATRWKVIRSRQTSVPTPAGDFQDVMEFTVQVGDLGFVTERVPLPLPSEDELRARLEARARELAAASGLEGEV